MMINTHREELYIATGNDGKFEETESFLTNKLPSIRILKASIPFVEVQSDDQQEIVLDKARQAWQQLQKPFLVEDAGILFDRYKNFPGPLTKFVYQGIGIEGLLKLVTQGDRATFVLYLVYMWGPKDFYLFKGECKGSIVVPERFNAHPQLPYDDIFKPDGSDKTYAQLRGTKEFESFSYRMDALRKFLHWYKTDKKH